MGTKGDGNRRRIIEAADQLFYKRGYNQTSFQDISEATGIPRGNFYYYFKTKDDILGAVIDNRLDALTAMLKQCEAAGGTPLDRLLAFSNILETNRDNVLESGCPVGTLDSELAKDDPQLHEKSRQAFSLLRQWLREQFEALGKANADELAMDLLARIQGVTVLACAFNDGDFIRRSLKDIQDWIECRAMNQA